MCYSAMVLADWRTFLRDTGVRLGVQEFYRLYSLRDSESARASVQLPRGFDLELAGEPAIRPLIDRYRQRTAAAIEAELFQLRARKAEAERKLAVKVTRAASESRRIALAKLERQQAKLGPLSDFEPRRWDSRIYPRYYAPVIVAAGDSLELLPARFQCRPAGKPASIDKLDLFNARRDNLAGWWRELFGSSHCILPTLRFYENVTGADGANHVLQFAPGDGSRMHVAGLFSRWVNPGDPSDCLLSFAAVTDEPPAEVAAAGHDRIPVNLTWEAALQWLRPQGRTDAQLQALLDEGRQRPYYEHVEVREAA